jgi:hypothetical protein
VCVCVCEESAILGCSPVVVCCKHSDALHDWVQLQAVVNMIVNLRI